MMRRATGWRRLAARRAPLAPSAAPGLACPRAKRSVRWVAALLSTFLSASLVPTVAWGRPIGVAAPTVAATATATAIATAAEPATSPRSATHVAGPGGSGGPGPGSARTSGAHSPRSAARKPSPIHPLTPAMAQCFDWASRRFGMSSHLLYAIALQESGLNPRAVHRNANGSQDIGLMQINSSWAPTLARYGIRPADLWDPCTNILVGAWILGDNLVRMGPTVAALGAYNARDPVKREAYARRVLERLHRLTTPPPHRVSPPPAAGLPPVGPHLVSR